MTHQQAAQILRRIMENDYVTKEEGDEAITLAIDALLPKVKPTLEDITQAVCRATGLTVDEVMSACQHREYTEARWMIWWIARKFIGCSTTTLARHFNRKSHVTVISGLRKGDQFMENPMINQTWVKTVNEIVNRITRS